MKYNNVLLILLSAFSFFQNSFSVHNTDLNSDDLTLQLRQEFITYQELLKLQLTPELYESHYEMVVVDSNHLPLLYAIISQIAHEYEIEVPQVYIYKGSAKSKELTKILGGTLACNACAIPHPQTGKEYITIGMDLLTHPTYAFTYEEFCAVLAHECAHIKEHHCNKIQTLNRYRLLAQCVLSSALGTILHQYAPSLYKSLDIQNKEYGFYITKYGLISYGAFVTIGNTLSSIFLEMPYKFYRRQFENEADALAIKSGKSAKSLISAIEKIERMYEREESLSNMLKIKLATLMRDHPFTVEREKTMKALVE